MALATGGSGAVAEGVPSTITAESCTTCHGPGGIGSGAIPRLAGEPAADLSAALTGFRDGTRESTIMSRLTGPLTDEDIAGIADYFSSLGAPAQ
ncbi:c-type cytochrome [Sinisalibacter aestuarii]|uniref:Cytochrome c domain-containing protein n=1 Tax=Sinisalibacter aestuarii TaxID=2949426 RepID=A0ABQ5LYT3_9RHOB|nr:c-type cytochrome [Sinisalibacter aestuarii]GKY89560.1 hypothetical protein STA1M1_34290 [Sinisalibacter aestuarii]